MTWGDKVMAVAFKDGEVCYFKRGHSTYEGTLSFKGDRLIWPDGAVWTRKAPLRKHTEEAAPVYGAADSGSRACVAESGSRLSLEQALSLQRELYLGFTSAAFRKSRAELEERCGKGLESYPEERSRLFLTVQSKVLPRYGFEGNQNGVLEMLDVGARFNQNAEYREKRDQLNQLLWPLRGGDEDELKCSVSASEIEVTASHYFERGTELRVRLPSAATFRDVKEAISEQVGSTEILEHGKLIRKDAESRSYAAYNDADPVGEVRQVLVFRASLRSTLE
eukprot:CAMPEP_0180696066 /NCGR_PEP_ID=MMETSP1038_2-20121128/2779_1 /TAXON_ID=632150 /ORGANISM="Azadinium spinosum, Strain 3D9" /LENGTH=278 /DNA_ID=CAMNT_0022727517 /DNA_START=9 /DNA_END=845 /DNA_ORIENTATION=+